LVFLTFTIIVKVDVVALEVLVLRRKFSGIEVVVDIRVGLFGQGAPIVGTSTVLSEGLVKSGLGYASILDEGVRANVSLGPSHLGQA
jgi:hypothetical protein